MKAKSPSGELIAGKTIQIPVKILDPKCNPPTVTSGVKKQAVTYTLGDAKKDIKWDAFDVSPTYCKDQLTYKVSYDKKFDGTLSVPTDLSSRTISLNQNNLSTIEGKNTINVKALTPDDSTLVRSLSIDLTVSKSTVDCTTLTAKVATQTKQTYVLGSTALKINYVK